MIVGASFAGLAAALELAGTGRVLLLDRAGIGEGETAACATPLSGGSSERASRPGLPATRGNAAHR